VTKRARRSGLGLGWVLILSFTAVTLFVCVIIALAFRRAGVGPAPSPSGREVALRVAFTPEKQAIFGDLATRFNEGNPRLASGKRVIVEAVALESDDLIAAALASDLQAVSPDSSLILAELDRRWNEQQSVDTGLASETTRYMVSPVVIAMWEDVARSLGYPDRALGWADLLRAAQDPAFKWSHPSTGTASGLLATLAEFYAGAGVTRGLTQEMATRQETLDYVSKLEKTVKHYGEGELAIMEQVAAQGRAYLDAFVVQEQMVVQYNRQYGRQLVAIYPAEGAMWADHPLALLEHPARTDEERLAYRLFADYLLTPEAQKLILDAGYRPTDLSIRLNVEGAPIAPANGADPAQPSTTLQIPSAQVIGVVKDAWQYTKRLTNIYLVADISGSMEGVKLRDAKSALHAFLDQIPGQNERVGLIVFSSYAAEVAPLTALSEGRDELEQAIDGLQAGGNTALLDAVDLAYTKLADLNDAERINAIVVMTDGKENASRTTVQELSARLGTREPLPVVVFCIAYGRDADMAVLNYLAEAGDGFTRRGDLETIEDLYKTLSTYF